MYYGRQRGFMGVMMTPGVRALMTATAGAFLIQLIFDRLTGGAFTILFGLSRSGLRSLCLWQPITYMFLHGNLWHILLNMIALFFFGAETERHIGTRRFLSLYFICGIAAGFGWLLLSGSHAALCIGASGAVLGVLGAFAGFFPDRPITLLVFFIIPVTMKARTLAIALGIINLLSMISGPDQIAYAAHLAGGLAGYIYARYSLSPGSLRQLFNPVRRLNDLRWRWQRRKFRVLDSHTPPRSSKAPPPEEIDRILEKIAGQGMHSLTRQEREDLEKASRRPW